MVGGAAQFLPRIVNLHGRKNPLSRFAWLKNALWLAWQIHVLTLSGLVFGAFAWLLDWRLPLLLLGPVAIHLWSGLHYGADRGNSHWTRHSIVLALLALLELPAIAATFFLLPDFRDFLWLYSAFVVLWTIGAWVVGAMALVDDWM
jgi:hypothetical protein